MIRVGSVAELICFLSFLWIGVNSTIYEYEPYSLIQETSLIAFFPLDNNESISNIAPHFDLNQPGYEANFL